MLEQLFSLIQEESQTEIINNPNIPNEYNNRAVGMATESIFSGLQNVLANGGLQDVLGLFSGKSQVNGTNPVVGGIIQNLIGSLMARFGLSNTAASGIAGNLIPNILGSLIGKTNSPENNGFDINGILGALIGGNSRNGNPVEIPGGSGNGIDFGKILGAVGGGAGLDRDGDGVVDMQDLIGMVSGAASNMQKNQQNQGGGIMDILGGLLGG